MNEENLKPMKPDKIVGEHEIGVVMSTYDYDKFSLLEGNRPVIKSHKERLQISSTEKQIMYPILVNEKYRIIEGQHRYFAWKDAGLPIYYIMQKGLGLSDSSKLHENMKAWTWQNMLNSQCDAGEPKYLKFNEFKHHYNLNFSTVMQLFLGLESHSIGNKTRSLKDIFFAPDSWQIKNYNEACQIAEKIIKFNEFGDFYKNTRFIDAIVKVFKIKDFKYEQLMLRMRKNRSLIYDCASTRQFREMLHHIYNFKSAKENRLDLRIL